MSPGWERWLKHWEAGDAVEWPAADFSEHDALVRGVGCPTWGTDDPEGAGARSAGAAKYGEMNWDKSGAGARSRTEYAEPSTPAAASGDCAPALVESLKSQIAALHLKIAQLEDEHKEQIRKLCAAAAKATVIEEAPAFPVNALKWSA